MSEPKQLSEKDLDAIRAWFHGPGTEQFQHGEVIAMLLNHIDRQREERNRPSIVTPLLTPLRAVGSGNVWSIIDANDSHLGGGFESHTADEIVRACNGPSTARATTESPYNSVPLPHGVKPVDERRLSEILSGYAEFPEADLFEIRSLAYEVRNWRMGHQGVLAIARMEIQAERAAQIAASVPA
jgi:hypothetical protein